MKGDDRHHGTSPLRVPPKGSRLEALCRYLIKVLRETPPAHLAPDLALVAAAVAELDRLGLADVLHHPSRAELLLHIITSIRYQSLKVRVRTERYLQAKRRRGNPGGDAILVALAALEYQCHANSAPPGISPNRLHDLTARSLGPGIEAHHVRRAVESHANRAKRASGAVKADLQEQNRFLQAVIDDFDQPAGRATEAKRA